jgi:hypothetical protein
MPATEGDCHAADPDGRVSRAPDDGDLRSRFTSDRNFYDRHYFNIHSCGDEIFVIMGMGMGMGMGQYPNLGTSDAFVTISVGDAQFIVRASKELDGDRLNTKVGPIGVEIIERLRKMRVYCKPNEWGLSMDLVFERTVDCLEETKTERRMFHGRMQMESSRDAQVGPWSGTSRWTAVVMMSHRIAGRASATTHGASGRSASPRQRASARSTRPRASDCSTSGCRSRFRTAS